MLAHRESAIECSGRSGSGLVRHRDFRFRCETETYMSANYPPKMFGGYHSYLDRMGALITCYVSHHGRGSFVPHVDVFVEYRRHGDSCPGGVRAGC